MEMCTETCVIFIAPFCSGIKQINEIQQPNYPLVGEFTDMVGYISGCRILRSHSKNECNKNKLRMA